MTRRAHHRPSRDNLLPATHSHLGEITIPQLPTHSLRSWALGRGTVIWRIWPAVVFNCLFSAGVVAVSLETKYILAVPPVLLTVLGMIIGFVISYRAMTGYDRYWMGRTSWSDIIRTTRTMSRLIWHHVPPRLGPFPNTKRLSEDDKQSIRREMSQVMAEKRMALDMIEGFAVALKHHLRGELGIFYEDLYHLVTPLHGHSHQIQHHDLPPLAGASDSYGTFSGHGAQVSSSASIHSSHSVHSTSHHGLPYSHSREHLLKPGMGNGSSTSPTLLFPFARFFSRAKPSVPVVVEEVDDGPIANAAAKPTDETAKHRPQVAGGAHAQNLPLDVLKCLSDWVSVLEDRGCVPGSATGGMLGCIAAFEDSLAALERILTTPLPFVYSVHIRHTVWVYLFFLPFQLLDPFGWYTIPGVAIASFIYLGFLAAGEEIEQPFGYDENDLDLDLFCRTIIHEDLERLKRHPCHNAYHADNLAGIAGTVAEKMVSGQVPDESNLLGFLG